MAAPKLIAVKEFCLHHQVKTDLILEMYSHEMLELVWIKRTVYIPEKNLPQLEKMIRLHRDLQLNLEGIQTVLQLLHSLEKKEAELQKLHNLLEFYTAV